MKTPVSLEFFLKDATNAVQREDVVIVIDVLRCCSTIVTALANGAKEITPAKTLKEARMLHDKHPECVLAGERKGVRPEGFDLGNSPLEFSSRKVKGRHIVLTTTSGTKAIVLSRNAKQVLIGALRNAETVAKAALKIARKEKVGISLILSGKSRHFFIEDFICAGAITQSLEDNKVEHSDAVLAALLCFLQARDDLEGVIQSGRHATYLKSVGFGDDVKYCSQQNVSKIVPYLNGAVITPLTAFAET